MTAQCPIVCLSNVPNFCIMSSMSTQCPQYLPNVPYDCPMLFAVKYQISSDMLHIILLSIGPFNYHWALRYFFCCANLFRHFFEWFLDDSRILQEFQLESDLNSVYESSRSRLLSNCEFIWPYCLGLTKRYLLDIDFFRPVNEKIVNDKIFYQSYFPSWPHLALTLNVKIFLTITKPMISDFSLKWYLIQMFILSVLHCIYNINNYDLIRILRQTS